MPHRSASISTGLVGLSGIPAKMPPTKVAAYAAHPLLWHSGVSVPGFYAMHYFGACLPLTAGALLYGWRSLVLVLILLISTLVATSFWRRIGPRGQQLRYSHAVWLAMLLAFMLPIHLLTSKPPLEDLPPAMWAILPASGFLLAGSCWVLGGVGSGRIHPVLVTYLLLVVFFDVALVPHWVLRNHRLFRGDAMHSEKVELFSSPADIWFKMPDAPGPDALFMRPASELLLQFTSNQKQPDRAMVSLDGLIRDDMPPLEDLILGGQPGPIGGGSAIAVIVGGLFLLYRGVIDFRIPLLIFIFAWLGFLIFPVPSVIKEVTINSVRQTQAQWHWLALRTRDVGVSEGITLANYEVLAGPLLLMSFFLATSPAVRPMARRGRLIYAVLIGIISALMQLYVSVSYGPYVALLMVSLLTPTFDKLFRPRPLI